MPDLSSWTGLPKVRSAFRQEGFGVPDAYARLAAEFCGGFTAEAFQDEDDLSCLIQLSKGHRAYEASGPLKAFIDRSKGMDPEQSHQQFRRPLTIARFEELERAEENPQPPLRKATEIRTFAESFGKANGFAIRRSKTETGFLKRAMAKTLPRTGLVGAFAIDAGGMSGFVLQPNGWPVYHASSVGLYFSIGADDAAPASWFTAANLVRGMSEYEMVSGVRGRRSHYDFSEPGDLDLISKTASWGAKAQIRFFDLFLAQLDADF